MFAGVGKGGERKWGAGGGRGGGGGVGGGGGGETTSTLPKSLDLT